MTTPRVLSAEEIAEIERCYVGWGRDFVGALIATLRAKEAEIEKLREALTTASVEMAAVISSYRTVLTRAGAWTTDERARARLYDEALQTARAALSGTKEEK